MKLLHRILAATILTFLGIIGLYHVLLSGFFTRHLNALYQQQATNRLAQAEEDVRSFLLAGEYQLNLLATITQPDPQRPTETRMAMGGLLNNVESFFRISAINANGKEWLRLHKFPTSGNDQQLNNYFMTPLYQRPMLEMRPYFGGFTRVPGFPLPFMDIAVPIKDRQSGKANGVIAAQVSFQPVQTILERYLPPQGKILLARANDNGVLVAADDSKNDFAPLERRVLARIAKQTARQGVLADKLGNRQATFIYRRFAFNDLSFLLLYYQPDETIYFLADRLVGYNVMLTIGGIVLFFLTSALLIRIIITPLSQITDQISALGKEYAPPGNTTGPPAEETANEVERLRLSFHTLKERLAIHKEASDNFQLTLAQQVQEKTREVDEANLALRQANENLRRDMERRAQMEQEKQKLSLLLQQAQKMEAVGTLAGGIAHDFNNILSAIMGYTELARVKLADQPEIGRYLGEVLQAGNRARELVKQILTFSRQSSDDRRPLEIGPVVREALKLLRASIPTTIEIRERIPTQCGMVLADATKIHQVLMNLCTNAYHAMREKGGVLAVELDRVQIDAGDEKVAALHLTAGSYLRLQVSDTGTGIDPVIRERIFDPYFTTKKKGEGTGMGLAVVHGIVKSHYGHISVYSEPGHGTSFRIYLPVTEDDCGSGGEGGPTEVPTGNEHILVVDDEETLVQIKRNVLTDLGYRVTATTRSPEALTLFLAAPDDFDLVITDMTMPQMTGSELSQKLLALRPELPIIICTGFSEMLTEAKAKAMGIREYILKPVSRRDLAVIVRRVLNEGPRQEAPQKN